MVTRWEYNGGMVILLIDRRIRHHSDWYIGQRAIFKNCKSSHTLPLLPNIQWLLITLELKVKLLKAPIINSSKIQLFFVFWINVFSLAGPLPVADTHRSFSPWGFALALPTAWSSPWKALLWFSYRGPCLGMAVLTIDLK